MEITTIEDLRSELLKIQTLDENGLKREWRAVLGTKAPPLSTMFMRRKLAYKIQELRFGGLGESDKMKIAAIGDAPKPQQNSAGIVIGTILEREWKGIKYVVIARENGFELNGRQYRSLSGAAKAITGTSWNGKKFFGV
ncbi:DUF2924 domain-containing protein [Victivallis sp. Marseille-Q1083]|uniref:DUF2924 domain-containing protein n=1 Tax=Victivallis sp. Marseille-Q1083 TaxID=2717288 RepID=UPI00158D63B8|nr:DUF2924 domain-containing protein [Victivallis sp. Marseille-Q1083]